MFDVRAVVRQIEAEENPESEGTPRAKVAKGANNEQEISTISTVSTPPTSKNKETSKIESLRLIYGGLDNAGDPFDLQVRDEPIPFTDDEIADHKINKLKLRGDRDFVCKRLKDVHGNQRLALVERYLEERQIGMDAEPVEHRKENAGSKRANTWLLELSKVEMSRF